MPDRSLFSFGQQFCFFQRFPLLLVTRSKLLVLLDATPLLTVYILGQAIPLEIYKFVLGRLPKKYLLS